jgi:hypothetical protein
VVDVSSTVAFWPVGVVNVKLEEDTASIVPTVPPVAGAVRAFDFPLLVPNPALYGTPIAEAVGVGVLELDVTMPTVAPVNPAIKANEAIHRLFLLRSHRGSFERDVGSSEDVCSVLFGSCSLISKVPSISALSACQPSLRVA